MAVAGMTLMGHLEHKAEAKVAASLARQWKRCDGIGALHAQNVSYKIHTQKKQKNQIKQKEANNNNKKNPTLH